MRHEKPMTGAERAARWRAAQRARGLRPRTFWLPDTRTPEFKEEARQSCEWLWRTLPDWEEDLRFAEAMTDEVLASLPPPEAND